MTGLLNNLRRTRARVQSTGFRASLCPTGMWTVSKLDFGIKLQESRCQGGSETWEEGVGRYPYCGGDKRPKNEKRNNNNAEKNRIRKKNITENNHNNDIITISPG